LDEQEKQKLTEILTGIRDNVHLPTAARIFARRQLELMQTEEVDPRRILGVLVSILLVSTQQLRGLMPELVQMCASIADSAVKSGPQNLCPRCLYNALGTCDSVCRNAGPRCDPCDPACLEKCRDGMRKFWVLDLMSRLRIHITFRQTNE